MRFASAVLIIFVAAGCTGIPTTSGPSRNGALCGAASDCASGQCVDGVCCESACDETCRSCAVIGQEGRCADVPDGLNPSNDCGAGVCAGSCNGQGACAFPAAEKACGDKLCVGAAIQTPVCNGAGLCAQSTQSCAPYGCEAAACKTSCADPSDCAGAARCLSSGTCEDKLSNGLACGSGTACASNFCADGVCCNSACGGSCQSCELPGSTGTCTAVPAGEDPANECTGTPPCGSSCDGTGQCAFGAQGTSCGGSFCTTDDSPLINRLCNGAGQCTDVLQACGLYSCQSNLCRSDCSADSHCRANAFCDLLSSQCVPRRVLGEACASPAQCASNFCADGVCCNVPCTGECNSCVGDTPGVCTLLGAGATPSPSCASAGQACGQGGGCPTSCNQTTSPCLATHFCNAGTCTPKLPNGTACTSNGFDCQSGFCSDNFCCAQNCANTPCRSCALPGQQGACLPQPAGFDGGSPPCAGQYACRADGTCANGACGSDTDCKPTSYCAGALGCLLRKPANSTQTCTRARECATNFCADGFCCTGACTAVCEACNLQGAQGACSPVPNSTDPNGECSGGLACNGARACYTGPCTATSSCEPGFVCQGGSCTPGRARGAVCGTTTPECGPGLYCADGVCCDQTQLACGPCKSCKLPGLLGTCTNAPANQDPETDCTSGEGGLTCNGAGACRTGCASSAECKSGYACNGGSCVLLRPYGAACSSANQCQSNQCSDSVCCDAACGSPCDACNFPGKVGTCTNYPAGSNPGNVCPGSNACNGFGACGSACTVDSQCAVGAFCNVNTCTPKLTDSTGCTADNQCSSGFCVDAVCCDSSCGGVCRTCNAPTYPKGVCTAYRARQDPERDCPGGFACQQISSGACFTTCANHNACELSAFCQGGLCLPDLAQGQSCTEDEACLSGFCADGVCCDRACAGSPCEACNTAGSVGVCTAHPIGTDPENLCVGTYCNGAGACYLPCPNDSVCKPGYYCETGVIPNACVLEKANGLQCARPPECSSKRCVDGVCCATGCAGVCESCNSPTPGTCAPHAARTDIGNECGNTFCQGAASACLPTCAAEADCKTGFYCNAGTCVAKKATGVACAVGVPAGTQCASGNCVDGFCCDTQCAGTCDRCDNPAGICTNLPSGTAATCNPYFCGGGANCPTSCAAQNECQTGYYCDTGLTNTCLLKKTTGTACGGGARGFECTTGDCVDFVCCGSACSRVCEVCNATPGTCTPAAAGTDPNGDCGGYVCVSPGTCLNSCTMDSQCVSTHFCNGTSCQLKLSGADKACARPGVCASGYCVDGYCCDTACGGNCDRCDTGGATGRGTCTNMGTAYPGTPACAPYRCTTGPDCTLSCSTDADCGASGYCSGTTCVNDLATASSCVRPEQCVTNFCAQTRCCSTACDVATEPCGSCNLGGASNGTCTAVGAAATPAGVCGQFLCQAGSTLCPTSCTMDSQCRTTGFCNGTACQTDLLPGQVCARNAQCANGCSNGNPKVCN